jgi:hypothetical protein
VNTSTHQDTTPQRCRHEVIGNPDEDLTVSDEDWPIWSAGFEAGLREGITRNQIQISVELVPVGPANAGIRLWRAVTAARLIHRTKYPTPGLSGQELRKQARISWGLPTTGRRDPGALT